VGRDSDALEGVVLPLEGRHAARQQGNERREGMIKRFLACILTVLALMLVAQPAQAMPTYGSRYTARNGWIVWAKNDRPYYIKSTCRWSASGTAWVSHWRIRPHFTLWTTSDAGNWGDSKPQHLRCTYVRL
jgi:hypothetical protein